MYQLYYYPLNASMAPHFVLQALNVDFELILVDRKSEAQKSAEYLALNPAGRIPTLVLGDLILSESAAICIHLAENHPESNLIPAMGSAERAKFFQWMMFLTSTLQAELMVYFYPGKHIDADGHNEHIIAAQESLIGDALQLIDDELDNQSYLLGEQITVCDLFLFMLAVWSDELKKPPLSYPNLGKYLRKMAQHPAIIKVCEKENLSLADYQS